MKKHTNFHREIDGRYYYHDDNVGFGLYAALIIAGLSVILLVAEVTGLTDWFIGLWN